jgi:hypothetical protein
MDKPGDWSENFADDMESWSSKAFTSLFAPCVRPRSAQKDQLQAEAELRRISQSLSGEVDARAVSNEGTNGALPKRAQANNVTRVGPASLPGGGSETVSAQEGRAAMGPAALHGALQPSP